jgi:recombination protein RecT
MAQPATDHTEGQNMTTAISTQQRELRTLVEHPNIKHRLEQCLGKRGPQFATSLLSLVNGSEQLQQCDPNSIIQAAMTAATLDLPIQKDLGFAAIVPYKAHGKAVAQFQMGWKGFVQLGQRTGQYRRMSAKVINAESVGELDAFGERQIKWGEWDETKPAVGYWFGFELLNGFMKADYWPLEKCMAHAAKYSKAYQYDLRESKALCPWSTDVDAMCLKTVVKLTLAKWGPLSVQMQQAISADQAASGEYVDNPENEIDVTPPAEEEKDSNEPTGSPRYTPKQD